MDYLSKETINKQTKKLLVTVVCADFNRINSKGDDKIPTISSRWYLSLINNQHHLNVNVFSVMRKSRLV